jgi:hypothetical protein
MQNASFLRPRRILAGPHVKLIHTLLRLQQSPQYGNALDLESTGEHILNIGLQLPQVGLLQVKLNKHIACHLHRVILKACSLYAAFG